MSNTDKPTVAPFGTPIEPSDIQDVWDVFVKPTQSEDAPPQSVETRVLMGILRWAYTELGGEGQ